MSRRSACRLFAAFIAALAVGITSETEARAQAPNVLLIVTDDQRAGTTGVMPQTRKWFWNRGRAFPRAYVTTPLCCPARASLFTGLFTHNHRVLNNGRSNLPQEATVQRYLQDAGYTTAIVGKYLNSFGHRDPPHFDRWATTTRNPYFDAVFNVDGELRTLDGYVTNVIARQGVRLLRSFESNDSQPWFLYIAPHAPHNPAIPEPGDENVAVPAWHKNPAVLEADRSDKPPWVRSRSVSLSATRALRADQLRTLKSVDRLVGTLFDEMGSLGERRSALAFFLTDNGYLWGEHGTSEKRHPYTDSIRIDLAMRWPGHVAGGSRQWRVATNVDIAPTILAAAGVPLLLPMDGRSLLEPWRRSHLFTEFWRDIHYSYIPSWDAIRTRRIHYIQYYNDDRSAVVFREYYRLRNDPWELHNLLHDGIAGNNPNTRFLRALIRHYRTCAGESCP